MFLSVRVNRRLNLLGHAMDQAAAGDLDQSLAISGNDEVARLQENFNAMMAAMKIRSDEFICDQKRIRSVHQSITDGIMVFDRLGRVVSVNPVAEAIIGRLETDIAGLWSVGLPVLEDLVTIPDLVA